MYLHLGEKTVVLEKDIIGIFDMDTSTVSKHTRNFLATAEKTNKVINVSYELPKSFVVCQRQKKAARNKDDSFKCYISQISTTTLMKRSK